MALQTTKVLIDDIDGTKETDKPVQTHRFTIDGTQYEIDLCEDNHEVLLKAVANFVQKARVISRPKKVAITGQAGSKKAQARIDRAQLDYMRQWLRTHGETVSDFGMVPKTLREKFDSAHQVRTLEQQQAAPARLEDSPQFVSAG